MKKYSWIIAITFTLIVIFITVGYSAFNIEMNIDDILSYYRAESNIRITALSVDSVENDGKSLTEEYGKETIISTLSLPKEDSKVTYAIDVTNLGGTYMVISEIKNIPENLKYQLENYSLNHIICTDEDECTLGITKQILLTIQYEDGKYNSENTEYNLNIDIVFEEFTYTINYNSGPILPSEYQELEYIESKRNRRINTLYIPKKNTSIELDLSFSGTFTADNTGTNAFFSSTTDIYTFAMNFGANIMQGNEIFTWFDVQYAHGGEVYSLTINDNLRTKRNTVKYSNGVVSYGNISLNSVVKTTDHTKPLYLFGSSGADFNRYDMKVYRLKLYESGELVSDFIPCYRVSDNKSGMYDTVRRLFVSDIQGEEFELGPEVNNDNPEVIGEMTQQIVRYNEQTTLKLNTYQRSGYFFKEWNTDLKNQGTTYKDGQEIFNLTEVSGTTIDLYAIWDEGFVGFGSEEKPYLINSIEDLVLLGNIINSNKMNFQDEYFLMTRDLDFNDNSSYKNYDNTIFGDINGDNTISNIKTELTTGLGFTPIGTENAFKGNFDGASYALNNLYIYNSTIDENQEPLSGAITEGTLSLFSKVTEGTINNLNVSGNIYSSIALNIGGIVGELSNGIIENVESNITITLDNQSTGGSLVGGVVSMAHNNSQIINSINNGDITNTDITANNRTIIGGVLAENTDTLQIKNCGNTGDISYGWRTGGIEGALTTASALSIIDSCYNTGNITGSPKAATGENTHTGGIIGLIWAPAGSTNKTYIINSSNSGNVIAKIQLNASGIIGSAASRGAGYIINSYNAGNITGESTGIDASGIADITSATTKKLLTNNVFNYGLVSSKSKPYGIGYFGGTAYTITNTYYNSANTASNRSVGIKKTSEEFNTQEFVDTLNSNINSIDLDSGLEIKLKTDYGITLCPWKLGSNGYPELDC